ncbi:acetyl-CoA carboxylase biotin carboxyl carrier protein subunit [Pseudohoeflea coraliihabitans]|uniref:Acetyl-CoA carboxylase biotin carboxyl carrier protein subunit n=1 Tax=Pseudohoeflea coraliihabitans TaxID=2860393 RepID=A0ABS6WIM1_9HYPH|nr:acetyl-CoA carboxylase biotin carboxyl carrier protein subunit [Pseudohoeflea sp. DP4N28-3]MBW3095799.1 acetyl-CoA carboxylase biotin carboxyl carrier protein subunit [Pseudohoeflea sp. DP4N28-3]
MARVDVKSEVTGTVWKIESGVGASVGQSDPVIVIESMKMEIPVVAATSGTVAEVLVGEGDMVSEGDVVARIDA